MEASPPHEPLTSVIMPAYNAAPFIGEAISSVIAQSLPHWELIIVDDGSTDETAQVVASFNDPRIVWTPIAHTGVNMAVRNAGLRRARGDYLAFLDADDRYYPDALARLTAHLQQRPDCTAVYGYYTLIDASGAPKPMPWAHLRANADGALSLRADCEPAWRHIFWSTPKQLQSLMLRRETLERVGFFHEDMAVAEDTAFYIRLFLDNFAGVHTIPAHIFEYRVYETSITQDKARFQQVLASIPRLYEGVATHPALPTEIRQRWSELCARHIGSFYARGRLQSGLMAQTRRIVAAAWGYPFLRKSDWARHCLPFALLSLLPPGWLAVVKRLRRRVKGYC